tara:strand:+ start:364 stop:738 length:375 start_codon:yes stop_codon:yes gene_type:complete
MSLIYIYDENMKKSRDAVRHNQANLLKKFTDFQKLKFLESLDKQRKREILEPFIVKFQSQINEKNEQVDGLEKISLYLDELLEEKRENETELTHIKAQCNDIEEKIKAIKADLAKLSLLVSRDI